MFGLFRRTSKNKESRASLENPDVDLYEALALDQEGGGKLGRNTALSLAAFWRAVFMISRDLAKVPFYLLQEDDGGLHQRVKSGPIARILRNPSRDLSRFDWLSTMAFHVLTSGNAYGYLHKDTRGQLREIIPLDPETVEVRYNAAGQLEYKTKAGVKSASEIFHWRGLSYDGLKGVSVLEVGSDSLKTGTAAQRYERKFFENGARPGGVLEAPKNLKPEERDVLRRAWERLHQGVDNAHRVAVLENGITFKQTTIDAKAAALIETRQLSIRDVANLFGCPPHKLGDNAKVSYSSLEQENSAYLGECLDPWLCSFEQALERVLLTESQRNSQRIEADRSALIRTDMATRFNSWNIAIQGGWMSRDEVRELEGMNPIPDNKGAEFLVPLNMGKAGEDEPTEEPGEDDTETDDEDGEASDD